MCCNDRVLVGVFSSAGDHLHFINPQSIPFGGATPAMFFGASKGVNVRPLGLSIASRLPLRIPNLSQTQVVNVKDFGAKAVDGVDDSEAIANAFKAALASNKPLYFPAGRYSTGDKPVLFSLGSQARSMTIFGDGMVLFYGLEMLAIEGALSSLKDDSLSVTGRRV